MEPDPVERIGEGRAAARLPVVVGFLAEVAVGTPADVLERLLAGARPGPSGCSSGASSSWRLPCPIVERV